MWAACSGLHQPGQSDDPVQSLKRTSLALVAAAIDRALAMDAAAIPEPTVNATQPRQAVPVRTASAERSDLGGGFIEFFVRRSASEGSALSGATDLPVLAVLLRAAAAFGTNASSTCVRLGNEGAIDVYGRVNVGTGVTVL